MAAKKAPPPMMAMFGGAFRVAGLIYGVCEWTPGTFFLVVVSQRDGSLFPVRELTRAEALREPVKVEVKSWAEV